MNDTHPRFNARLVKIHPVGIYTHALIGCPRCKTNMGITDGMVAGTESIICEGKLPTGDRCAGHYYWREGQLVFVGTAP